MTTHQLSDDERSQLSVRADEFHAALARGGVGDWGPFLAELPERLRPAVLAELVIIDLIYRWEHKERPEVEEYVARFPELGPPERVPAAVILEEWRCRVKAGEHADPARYRSRFPAQYPLIRAEIEGGQSRTVAGTMAVAAATLASDDGGAAIAQRHSASSTSGADEYEFLRILGRGVFGEVWLARKHTSGIEKAVKILLHGTDRESSGRERRSLELIKNLRHPYLLATEDFWVAGNRLHIVMELADCTLRNRLQKYRDDGQPGIPEDELLGYIWEAAEGLDFLHARHVIHRDVKPDNILLLHGHAKVADFGLARHQEGTIAPMMTFAGSPAYMAPEVWGKEGGPPSDLYSLAVTYAELRQGHPPLTGGALQEMLIAHMEGTFQLDTLIGAKERAVLVKALARKPEDRFSSCRAFVEAMAAALGIAGVQRLSGSLPSSSRPREFALNEPTALDSEAGNATHNSALRATLANTPTTRLPSPDPATVQSRPFNGKRAAAVLLTLGLLAGLGLGAWQLLSPLNGNGTTPTPEPTKPTIAPDPGTKPGPNTTPITPLIPAGPVLPPRAVRDTEAKEMTLADGRKVFAWVKVPVGGETVRFRLIEGSNAPRTVAPFYIMESKVWNALYRAGGAVAPAASEMNGPDAPVMDVTAEEAARFAADALGGKLPSPDEWDAAAGLYASTGREDVTRPGGRPRVRLAKPEATHGENAAGLDVNEFGLRDMAGNGREWTRAVLNTAGSPRVVGVDPLAPTDLVILRGRNFTLSRGLTFEMLKYEQTTPQTQFATARSPYTGFRVVLPLP